MEELTLRQLCKECGVSRRAIQGYEKYKLVKSTGKTDRGYLLYDRAAEEKVKLIKSLQNYGFTVKEIVEYHKADIQGQCAMLREKLEGLKVRQNKTENYIAEIQNLIREKEFQL